MPRPQTPLFRNPTRALARCVLEEAIRRPGARSWTLQGFGVLRLNLHDDMCLHVWCPDLAAEGAPTIHDHPWQFSSFVVAGIAENHRFECREPAPGQVIIPTQEEMSEGWRAFYRRTVMTGQPGLTAVLGDDRMVMLRRLGLERVRAGAWYHQSRGEIHESRPHAGTVTLVQRLRDGDERANIFFSPLDPPADGNKRPATDAEVVHACTVSVRKWLL